MRLRIVTLKAEHPPFSLGEIARICYVLFGKKPSKHTVKRIIEEGPTPLLPPRRYVTYHEMPKGKERRKAVVSLHLEGWSVVLSDRHGKRRDRAFIEANIGASAAAVFAPVLFGFLHGTPVGWRTGLLLPVVALGALFLVFHRDALPVHPPPSGDSSSGDRSARRRLPAAYWLLALLVASVVAVEFCVVFYGAELLKAGVGMATADAATTMGVFYVGILLGRIVGSGLTRRPGRAVSLVLSTLLLTTVGFLAFWLSGQVVVATAGLFVMGLGVANLYPLTLALAIAAAPGQTDKANARTQLLIGAAVVIAPLALGALSDAVSVPSAFAVEPALIAIALALLFAGCHKAI